ncbi:unnamed protein product [Durusdinium trenchii]|uniref:Transmembrane protein n=1 Tax=Durusdinium trenchii TaxID=1381693 RepID=A0ABP0NY80_9DINO
MGQSNCCHEDKVPQAIEEVPGHAGTGPGDVPKAPAAVTLDACNAEETGEALPVTFNSCRSHFGRIQRQNTNRQLLVDTEILRSVSLRRTLHWLGEMWSKNPAELSISQGEALWSQSHPALKYDIFLSHTWQTSGTQKFLALSLQSGWSVAIAFWLLGVSTSVVLCLCKVLPTWPVMVLPNFDAPTTVWTNLLGLIFLTVGFLIAPYLPRCRSVADACFLDVACVNQSDRELMERAVYGLGGFLSVSDELRVLWSPPYLSRLWCIFELAAYRSANPTGRIRFAPIYIELSVLVAVVAGHVACCFFAAFTGWLSAHPALAAIAGWLPLTQALHTLRRLNRSRAELISEMQSFSLSRAVCSNSQDRDYVMSAIAHWYQSPEGFEDYVRGPLRQELMRSISFAKVSPGYLFLIATAPASAAIQVLIGFWESGASREELLCSVVARVLSTGIFWMIFCAKMCILNLCHRFAARWPCCDLLPSLLISLALLVATQLGVVLGRMAAQNLLTALIWLALSLSLTIGTLRW